MIYMDLKNSSKSEQKWTFNGQSDPYSNKEVNAQHPLISKTSN